MRRSLLDKLKSMYDNVLDDVNTIIEDYGLTIDEVGDIITNEIQYAGNKIHHLSLDNGKDNKRVVYITFYSSFDGSIIKRKFSLNKRTFEGRNSFHLIYLYNMFNNIDTVLSKHLEMQEEYEETTV